MTTEAVAAATTVQAVAAATTVQAVAVRLARLLEDIGLGLNPGELRIACLDLARHLADDTPLLGIAGRLNVGKSTLSNALTGGRAPTAPTECTVEPRRYRPVDEHLAGPSLRCATIDTPGADSVNRRGPAALAGLAPADIAVYVVVTPTVRDVTFLASFAPTRLFSPANTVVVVNRLDERVRPGQDPTPAAAEAIAGYRRTPQLRPFTILPIIALLAETHATRRFTAADLAGLHDAGGTERRWRLLGPYGAHALPAAGPPDLATAYDHIEAMSFLPGLRARLAALGAQQATFRCVNVVRRAERLVETVAAGNRAEVEALRAIDDWLTRTRRRCPPLMLHDVANALAGLAGRTGPAGAPTAADQCLAAYERAGVRLAGGEPPDAEIELLRAAGRSGDRLVATSGTTLRHHLILRRAALTDEGAPT
ncbi:GTPase [Dactylosporangium cerinum]|uniref:GTPase n=1 Tax=Dactylosporangium cerinum TaxID=1434730 RepID=A0ABV9VWL9_9ACTN